MNNLADDVPHEVSGPAIDGKPERAVGGLEQQESVTESGFDRVSAGLVSVIIVAHNNWPDLELAIQSALHQSYTPLEVIVVDNYSIDETVQSVPKLFRDRVRYVRQSNSGEGGGRNTGVRLAKGEFIQFLDGDDFLAPDKIEKQIAMLNSAPETDIVYGDVRQFQTCAGRATFEDWETRDHEDMLATLLEPQENGAGLLPHSVILRRRALDTVGPWLEDTPAADQDYWLRAAWLGCRFRYCPRSLCFYRRRPGQITSSSRDMMRGMEQVFIRAEEYITQEPYRTAVAQLHSQVLFHMAVSEKEMTVSVSLSRLKRARQLRSGFVTRRAMMIGWLLIVTRIGPFVCGQWLRPVRRLTAKLAGIKKL